MIIATIITPVKGLSSWDVKCEVVHYGEENSRHFRYLCMKSEYDKMFYQHHTMMASNTQGPEKNPQQSQHSEQQPTHQRMNNVPKTNSKPDCDKRRNPCTCRGPKMPSSTEPHKVSSEENTGISNKSSEMGMREVLEHIQLFCNQMQLNDFKGDDRMPKNVFRMEDAMKINKQVFEDDDDDFQMSSDSMTPRSDEHLPAHKYGGSTMRSCNATRGGTGGGDA